MNIITLSGRFFQSINLKFCQFLFSSHSGWDENSYCVFEMNFPDGSRRLAVDYPTDLTAQQAQEVVQSIHSILARCIMLEIDAFHMTLAGD